MLPQNKPDRIRILFDDHRLVANAGLLLPATLARHLGLRELVDHHLDLGGAPGRANTGDKMLTLVASALAGGHPPARQPAGPDRGDQRRTGLPFPTGWTAPPMSPRRLTPRSRRRTPRRCGSCPAGDRRPVPSSPSSPDTAITPSSPTAMGRRWNWRPIIAATPRSRTPYATSSTASG